MNKKSIIGTDLKLQLIYNADNQEIALSLDSEYFECLCYQERNDLIELATAYADNLNLGLFFSSNEDSSEPAQKRRKINPS